MTMKQIEMTFICGQDWDSMKVTANGRFCDSCNHEVYDFSGKSMEEINVIKVKQKEVLCGRFMVKPDSNIIAPISAPKPLKIMSLLSSIFLSVSLNTVTAQTTNKIHTEQTDQKHNDIQAKDTIFLECDSAEKELPLQQKPKPFFTTKKKEYYWTKKFPFVKKAYKPVKTPTVLMGRFL